MAYDDDGQTIIRRLETWVEFTAKMNGLSLAGVRRIEIGRGLHGAHLVELSGPGINWAFHVDADGAELVGREYFEELEAYRLADDAGLLPGGKHG